MQFFGSIIAILLLVTSVYSNDFQVGICYRQDTLTVTTLTRTLDEWNSLHSGNAANCWFCPRGIDCTTIAVDCKGRRCSDSELTITSSNQMSCMSSRTTTNAFGAPVVATNLNTRNDFSRFDSHVNNQLVSPYGAAVAPIQPVGYGYGAPVIKAPLYNAPYYGSSWNMYNDYSRYDSRYSAGVVNTPLVAPIQTVGFGYGAPVIKAPLYNAPYYGSSWNMYNDYSRYDSRYSAGVVNTPLVPPIQTIGYGAPVISSPGWNSAPLLHGSSYGDNIGIPNNGYGDGFFDDNDRRAY